MPLRGGPQGSRAPTQGAIFVFWLPLAATWVMMAAEVPFIAALVARLQDPELNLAAFGITLAIAFLVEAPVVMLMAASTALASDRERFRRLRTFAYLLNGLATLSLLVVLLPPVFSPLLGSLLAVPDDVSRLVYRSLWLILPWPAAIGYRRFYQGLLIRGGKTRLVAVGTIVRLGSMGGAGLGLMMWGRLPGAMVAAGALTAGVTVEAVISRWMAIDTIRGLRSRSLDPEEEPLTTGSMMRFYLPLALTSLIGFAVHPLLTFFMSRAPQPISSLAVFPVVNGFAFLFRSVGLAFQEVSIALLGRDFQNLRALRRFATWLALATSGVMALVALTPLSGIWFGTVSGLTPALIDFAILPTVLLVPLPFLTVVLSLFRGIHVTARVTRPITMATVWEVAGIAVVFPLLSRGFGVVGVTAAAAAFVVGRSAGVASLIPGSIRLTRTPPPAAEGQSSRGPASR